MKSRAMLSIAVVVMLLGLSPVGVAVTLSDNLGVTVQDCSGVPCTEPIAGDHWAASSFGTDGLSNLSLQSVTLYMSAQTATGGTAQVDIYNLWC